MSIVINGTGSISGLAVGGLPDGTVDAGTLATNSVDSAELIDGSIDTAHIAANQITSAIMPAGSVLQVLEYKKTTFLSQASNSAWADISGFSLAITPAATSSKILVLVNITGNTSNLSYVRVVRGSTAVGVGTESSGQINSTLAPFNRAGDTNTGGGHASAVFLDSPSSTSATTYKLQLYCETSNTFYMNRSADNPANDTGWNPISSLILVEVGA